MQELSKRLFMVSAMLGNGNVIADVGCDHAYLPIYLINNNKFKKAIAMDVNRGPLEIAMRNVSDARMLDRIELRLSDGVSAIEEGEVEAVSICGMGGNVMMHIFKEGENVLRSTSTIVVQPQSEIEGFRKFLRDNKYQIVDEDICFEDGKYYFAFKVQNVISDGRDSIKVQNTSNAYDFIFGFEDKYSRILLEKRDIIFYKYLVKQKETLQKVADNLKVNSPDNMKLDEIVKEIFAIKNMLELYK